MAVQCPDRECYLQTRLASTCILYDPYSHPNCSIPCKMESCTHQLVNNIVCNIWRCQTPTTSTTETTTFDPNSTTLKPGVETSVGPIFSYSVNVLFLVIGFSFLIKFLKKRAARRAQKRLDEMELRERLRRPIIRYSIDNENSILSESEDFSDFTPPVPPVSHLKSADVSFGAKPKKFKKKVVRKNEFQVRFHKFLKDNFDVNAEPLSAAGASFLNPDDNSFLNPNDDPEDLEWFHDPCTVSIDKK